MDDDQQFCLRWNNHQSTLISVFDTLLENGTLVDCTLAAEGKFLKAHKVVLSACSTYFATLLSQQYDKHPIFILKDVKFQELKAMMDYMYRGEVNISQDQLAALLKAAESLQIKGLSDSRGSAGGSSGGGQKQPTNEHKQLSVPAAAAGKSGATSGYTLEQKRPRHAMGPSSIDSQELSGSREGSSSPTSRKRKKVRRRSLDNIIADNHDHSNSSSHSMQVNSSIPPSNTSAAIASVSTTAATSSSTPTTVAAISGGIAAGLNVTKKTESVSNAKLENVEHDMDNDNDDDDDDDDDEERDDNKSIAQVRKEQNHKRKTQTAADSDNGKDNSEMLIEPKSEYDDGNDENVEDLTLDDEELLEDLDQAGPSHGGGEGSSQGYAQWQVDRSQDDVFMATQEAAGQQRDPQDLRTKVKASRSPASTPKPLKLCSRTPSVSSLSDMLYEFYKSNNANVPKNSNKMQNSSTTISPSTTKNNSTTKTHSIVTITETDTNKPSTSSSTTKITHTPTTPLTASKNLHGDEMVPNNNILATTTSIIAKKLNAPFHPRIKYSNVNNKSSTAQSSSAAVQSTPPPPPPPPPPLPPSIPPTSVIPAPVIQPPIIPPATGSAAAAIAAAAFFRDEYRHFHQQLRAHEILQQQQQQQQVIKPPPPHHPPAIPPLPPKSQFYLPNFLKNDHYSENDLSTEDGEDDDDDDDDGKYPEIDDIHLIEGSKSGYPNHLSMESDYLSDESHKYSMIAAHALRNLEYSLSEYGGNSVGEEQLYNCRHCGKKYRWKSTLRRHENVECGGKEPSHQCPYCPYKSKQRGNLGVHVRKHHANLPQLASKRRSKYSQPRD